LAIFKEIQYLCYRRELHRDILGIDRKDKVFCLEIKFVFLFKTVVKIQGFKCGYLSVALQDFPFSGPTSVVINSIPKQAFYSKICGVLDH